MVDNTPLRGVSVETPPLAAYSGIFNNHNGDHLSSFSCNFIQENALFV